LASDGGGGRTGHRGTERAAKQMTPRRRCGGALRALRPGTLGRRRRRRRRAARSHASTAALMPPEAMTSRLF